MTSAAIEASGAGRRYGRFWALRECTLSLPPGSITALVGPNGAGKTTLLSMLAGLLPVSEGRLTVLGQRPSARPEFLARVGFLGQDCPLYKHYTVADMLHFGRATNPGWDDQIARERIAAAEVPLSRRAGKLSGGQRAQVGLALAVAKRPELLLLDEPLAALDPLARRDFLKSLIGSAAAGGTTVVLSSHLIGDLARVCDQLVVLRAGGLMVAGELDALLGVHHWVAGPRERTCRLPRGVRVVSQSRYDRHSRLLVRGDLPVLDPELTVSPVDIEDLVLAYLDGPEKAPVALIGQPG